jgi:ribosome-associated protein
MTDLMQSDPRLAMIVDVLLDKKALDITLMDLREISDTADFFVLCTGNSDQQVKTLAQDVRDHLKIQGHPPWHLEGMDTSRWILIDYADLVVHVFRREAREFYALERLWGDAEIQQIEDNWGVPAPPLSHS